MTIDRSFGQHINAVSTRAMCGRVEPISHVTLGEAADLCHADLYGKGKIPKETFDKIRAFRERMAEWDRKWGRV